MGLRSLAVFAAVLLGLAQPGLASDRLTLVTGEDYPPFADPRLPGGGLATMLVQQVVRRMGGSATLDFLPWRRGYEDALRGRYDATFPYVHTPERERDFLYSDSLIHLKQVVFMSAERPFAYTAPRDLQGRRACIALGYAAPAGLQVLIDQKQVERMTPGSAAMCPGLIAADRADFFIQDERIGSALVEKTGLSAAIRVAGDTPFGVTDIYFIVPRTRPDAAGLIERFNAGLRQLRASGEYEPLLLQ